MAEKGMITILNNQVDAGLTEDMSMNELEEKLRIAVNQLIQTDFQKLVTILYKIDVDEDKLKRILKEKAGIDAAEIIAKLILEREIQKSESRKRFKS